MGAVLIPAGPIQLDGELVLPPSAKLDGRIAAVVSRGGRPEPRHRTDTANPPPQLLRVPVQGGRTNNGEPMIHFLPCIAIVWLTYKAACTPPEKVTAACSYWIRRY